MFKNLILTFSFSSQRLITLWVIIFSLSACTLTEPGLEKNISTQNQDGEIINSNPEKIKINEQEDKNSLSINENNNLNLNLNKEENMQEPKEISVTATQAVISTSKGDIIIKLEPEHAPNTVKNFANKATQSFYENLVFHRVEDWVIQGGDPVGNGTGGGKMPTELNELAFTEGSVGVARGGDIAWSNDAQFFICTTDCNWLTGQYTNFGQVIEGMEVVKQIAIGDAIKSINTQ